MRKSIMIIGVALTLCSRAFSGQASFSNEGDKIYLIPVDGFGKLWIIDAVTHQSKSVSLGKSLAQANIDSLAIGTKGEVYVSAVGALWQWSEGDKDAKKITSYEEDYQVSDISCTKGKSETPLGTIFALGNFKDDPDQTLSALLPGKKKFGSVFCRRNDPFSAPQTDAIGRMFIASNCDLWECSFMLEDEPDSERAGTLNGCRIAPLAMMNTDIANSGAMVVREIASTGKLIYAITHGRHMGGVIQCAAPENPLYAKDSDEENPDLAASFTLMKNSLTSAKILYEGSPCNGLCAHQGNKNVSRVFWRQDLEGEKAWMMIDGAGAPEQIGSEKE